MEFFGARWGFKLNLLPSFLALVLRTSGLKAMVIHKGWMEDRSHKAIYHRCVVLRFKKYKPKWNKEIFSNEFEASGKTSEIPEDWIS